MKNDPNRARALAPLPISLKHRKTTIANDSPIPAADGPGTPQEGTPSHGPKNAGTRGPPPPLAAPFLRELVWLEIEDANFEGTLPP